MLLPVTAKVLSYFWWHLSQNWYSEITSAASRLWVRFIAHSGILFLSSCSSFLNVPTLEEVLWSSCSSVFSWFRLSIHPAPAYRILRPPAFETPSVSARFCLWLHEICLWLDWKSYIRLCHVFWVAHHLILCSRVFKLNNLRLEFYLPSLFPEQLIIPTTWQDGTENVLLFLCVITICWHTKAIPISILPGYFAENVVLYLLSVAIPNLTRWMCCRVALGLDSNFQ